MASRITRVTRRLDEPDLCKLLHELLEIKLQLKFLATHAHEEAVASPPPPRGGATASPTRRSNAPYARRKSSASLFRFRCMPELYQHTLPLVASDAEWNVELYQDNSKFLHGYDSLRLVKALHQRRAYAFLLSTNPHEAMPETFVVVRTVLEQCAVHLRVRTQPIGPASIDDVARTPGLVWALCNDPRRIFDHGYAACGIAEHPESTHRPLYRICSFETGEDAIDRARVLLAYESLPPAVEPTTSRRLDRYDVADEHSALVLACNLHLQDGAPSDPSRCVLETCNSLGFACLSRLIMGEHARRTIQVLPGVPVDGGSRVFHVTCSSN